MPKIRFQKDWPVLECTPGSNLMSTLVSAGIPVASSCGGDGICGKCKVTVVEGWDHLSPPEPAEMERLFLNNAQPNERLSCQCKILGEIKIHTNYW